MLEYKREKTNLEARLQELEKSSVEHDDHIRIIDGWMLQLLQEIQLLVDSSIATPGSSGTILVRILRNGSDLTLLDPFSKSALSFKESKDFQRHLSEKSKALKVKVEGIFARLESARGNVKPEVAELESQVKSLLANEKDLQLKLDRVESENTSLSEQLDRATLKSLKAERKLDRLRSAQVQKLEQQALAGATTRSGNEENGTPSASESDNSELRIRYEENVAAMAKQKEQLDAALAEIKTLQEENTTFKTKRDSISDEDYARTEVFKQFKLQNEDLIKRINHLQATNKELREEAERLHADRTSFEVKVVNETNALTSELEEQIQQKDHDLTRIRSARDELTAELAMRKASEAQERTAIVHMKELVEAQVDRIAELESELGRLRPSEDVTMSDSREDLDSLSPDELRQKYIKLEKDFEAINKELPLLEKSYKKAMGLAHKKVMDFHALEERVAILTAEKSKADQKYFAARKDMDIRTNEIRTLRGQNSKSSEIIAQLKEVEQQNRVLIGSLEKQIADLKQSNSSVMTENKRLELTAVEATRKAESTKAQVTDLINAVKSKDTSTAAVKEKLRDCETELEKAKARVKVVSNDCEKWKKKSQGNTSEEEEVLRVSSGCAFVARNCANCVARIWLSAQSVAARLKIRFSKAVGMHSAPGASIHDWRTE